MATLLYSKIKKLFILATFICCLSISFEVPAASQKDDFVIVIDAGHGGKDHGAIDNNAREKDINLAVAQRVAELVRKKLKDTEVIMTRDDDSFISLQGRADVANKAKADLFISIHTNSVDTKNKNRSTIAGASVYTLGSNKDEANMEIARRENSVIELEKSYEQKYMGFDPNKDESYIIFEMAQKKNISQSNRFAKFVQDNLVKIAGRKDRGVKQAGFWVLWSTSMPAVLIELDFICNPQSVEFMTSKEGVDKMAEAIFQAIKTYEQNYRQSLRMAAKRIKQGEITQDDIDDAADLVATVTDSDKKKAKSKQNKQLGRKVDKKGSRKGKEGKMTAEPEVELETPAEDFETPAVELSYRPTSEKRDKSHKHLDESRKQRKPKTSSDGRRRRSDASRYVSDARVVEGEITLQNEYTGEAVAAAAARNSETAKAEPESKNKGAKTKKHKKSSKKVSTKKYSTKASDKNSAAKVQDDKSERSSSKTTSSKDEKKNLEMEKRRKEKEMKEAQKRAMKEKKKPSDEKVSKKAPKDEDNNKVKRGEKEEKSVTESKDDKKKSIGKQSVEKPATEKSSGNTTNQEHGGRRKSLKRS